MKDTQDKKSMDENSFNDDDYDYTYDDHDYYDDYEDHSQAEQDEPKLALAGYRKRSTSKDSSKAMRIGRGLKDDNGKDERKDMDKCKRLIELNNSKLYSKVEPYELRKHIMDLIQIYREKVDNL